MGFCYKKQVRGWSFPWRTRNVNGNSEFGERKAKSGGYEQEGGGSGQKSVNPEMRMNA